MAHNSEVIDVVDKDDNVIEKKMRTDLLPTDIIRVASCFVIDAAWNILIAQRSENKLKNPNKWSSAVSETVQTGEEYTTAAVRGAQEEISLCIREQDLLFQEKIYQPSDNSRDVFKTWYVVLCSEDQKKSLKKQENEVQELRRVSMEELCQLIEDHPEQYSSSLPKMLQVRKQHRDEILAVLLSPNK